jgi:NADH-quinone oxidoreductase subunit H
MLDGRTLFGMDLSSYKPDEIAANIFRPMGYFWGLVGLLNFMIKTVLFVIVMMWVRWTLPRLRIDQVMTTCLKYCMPIAAIAFLISMGWTYVEWPSLNDIAPSPRYQHRGNVREGWTPLLVAEQRAAEKKAGEKPATTPPATAPHPTTPAAARPQEGI